MKEALGLIEAVGLAAAIEAADTCVKSANVRLLGYELTKGGGYVTVKIAGDVGAVSAAVTAATAAAMKVRGVYSTKVIPRPSEALGFMVNSIETVGRAVERRAAEDCTHTKDEDPSEDAEKPSNDEVVVDSDAVVQEEVQSFSCSICRNPGCGRQKGEPRSKCITYKQK